MGSKDLEQFTQVIREQVEAGKINSSLDQLKNYMQSGADKLKNDLSLYTSGYKHLRREEMKGSIPLDVLKAKKTELKQDFLQFLNELPKQIIDAAATPINKKIADSVKIDLPDIISFEEIIGANNLKQISWIQRGLQLSAAVCRILTPEGMGTGFLFGPNLITTNNHVIPEKTMADKSYAEFNYQADLSGEFLPSYRYKLKSGIFHTSPESEFDYTIVGIESNPGYPSLDTWGYLRLDPNYLPIRSEHVTIIQHPNGGPKQIALTANQVFEIQDPYIFYSTDTMPGSSGSPVFNDYWQVIALHHASRLQTDPQGNESYVNEGILMSKIKTHAGTLWPA